ncbi:MAG: hypothetical protein V8S35_06435 [Lachnospira sp.]
MDMSAATAGFIWILIVIISLLCFWISVPVRQITGIICGKTADTAGIGKYRIFL